MRSISTLKAGRELTLPEPLASDSLSRMAAGSGAYKQRCGNTWLLSFLQTQEVSSPYRCNGPRLAPQCRVTSTHSRLL